MRRNRPYSNEELNSQAKAYCATLRNRVINHRCNSTEEEFDSTKTDWWDIARVTAVCATPKPPFSSEHGRNCSYMRNAHPLLLEAYTKKGMTLGQKPKRTGDGKERFAAGQCAEPHAAHKLLNTIDKGGQEIAVDEIMFSRAYNVKNGKVRAYCETCKTVFPQLK